MAQEIQVTYKIVGPDLTDKELKTIIRVLNAGSPTGTEIQVANVYIFNDTPTEDDNDFQTKGNSFREITFRPNRRR